jgi:hypothetical protein
MQAKSDIMQVQKAKRFGPSGGPDRRWGLFPPAYSQRVAHASLGDRFVSLLIGGRLAGVHDYDLVDRLIFVSDDGKRVR